MASEKWVTMPGGRAKRWRATGPNAFFGAAPRQYRKFIRRQRRAKVKAALHGGHPDADLNLEVRDASWFW